jgi:cobalamin biosynthesis protein CbiG
MARLVTEAPETQIYFITHGSGAFPVPRVRTVVRGERASRSIVNRKTGLWSIWMVASLILAGLVLHLFLDKRVVAKLPNPEEIPDHLRHLSTCSIGLDGLYH